ncbi:MAG: hypothetical protein CMJ76_10515 [Planctomycetaceae bacterium]|nr:hypothetical protein [Planctomycetaceae bacterium]
MLKRLRPLIYSALSFIVLFYMFAFFLSGSTENRFATVQFDFTPPDAKTRTQAIGYTKNLVPELKNALENDSAFEPIAMPRSGDWLATHKETGQTYAQYLKSNSNRPDRRRNIIYLLPLDKFQNPALKDLASCMESFYGLKTEILSLMPIQGLAVKTRIHPQTQQRQALTTDILSVLKTRLPTNAYCLLAVTMTDLYPAESWNFVFGQASLQQRVGVYSFARYQPGFPGAGDPDTAKARMFRRSVKTLLHETAHMFGMQHCIYYNCLVNGSNHLQETDTVPLHFCPVCLRKAFRANPELPSVRYPRIAATFREVGLTAEAEWFEERVKTK